MTKDFLPEARAMALGGGYCGTYRLFEGDHWRRVQERGKDTIRQTYGDALKDAKAVLKAKLNPPLRAEKSGPSKHPASEYQIEKLKRQADMQREAFGGVIHKGQTVAVEQKGGRRGRRV